MPRANSADSRAGGGRLLLTNLGVRLAQLPVSPPLGKALLCGAAFGCLTPVSLIAAATDGDAMGRSAAIGTRKVLLEAASDHLALVRAMQSGGGMLCDGGGGGRSPKGRTRAHRAGGEGAGAPAAKGGQSALGGAHAAKGGQSARGEPAGVWGESAESGRARRELSRAAERLRRDTLAACALSADDADARADEMALVRARLAFHTHAFHTHAFPPFVWPLCAFLRLCSPGASDLYGNCLLPLNQVRASLLCGGAMQVGRLRSGGGGGGGGRPVIHWQAEAREHLLRPHVSSVLSQSQSVGTSVGKSGAAAGAGSVVPDPHCVFFNVLRTSQARRGPLFFWCTLYSPYFVEAPFFIFCV